MSFFRRFRANFNLKNPKKRKIEKSEVVAVQCLKYKIISEFTEEQVFNTSPRHISEQQLTSAQHRQEQIESLSENDLRWKRLATERLPEEKKSDVRVKNVIWPSENEINSRRDIKENHETKTEEVNEKIDETKEELKEPPIKSILKNINGDIKKDHVDNSKGKVNFGFQNGEEVTYEPFEKIDDDVEDNNMYFADDAQDDEKELYVVHKTNHEQQSSAGENKYEPPSYGVEDNYNKLHAEHVVKSPLYNTLTHPKLNPTVIREDDAKDLNRLNTFGNTQKLKNNNIGYSNQAANIFFDSDEEFEDPKSSSGHVTFQDNVSEISA